MYLPAVTLALGTGIAAPAIPVFAKSFDVSVGTASLVFIVHMLGGLVAAIPTGYLADRVGRRKIVLTGPLLVALSSFLVATSQSFEQLLVYRFIGGAAQQMWMLARLAIVADTGGRNQRGRQITGMIGMETTGRLMGPAIGGFIAALWDVRAPFIVHGILSLVAIIPSYKLVKETAPTLRNAEGRTGRNGAGTQRVTLAALLVLPVLMFFAAQFFASLTRGTMFSGAIHLYPVYTYGVGPEAIGLVTTVATAIGLPIVFSTGAIMDRFGRKSTIVPGFFLLSLALAAIAVTAFAGLPFEAYVVAYLLMQTAQSITSGNMQVLGTDIAPPHLRGRFFGIWRTVGEIGVALSPLCFGLLAETLGYGFSFAFLSSTALIAAVILMTQVKEPPKEPADNAARSSPPVTSIAAPVATRS